MNNITIPQIAEEIQKHDSIILLSHTNPDADTIGSVSALSFALQKLAKNVVCLCDKPVPERLKFICGNLYKYNAEPARDTLVISVDVASPSMLGALETSFADIVDIRIDHHAKGSDFARYNYVEPDAAACGEIIFELITALEAMDAHVASALYAAISSDTGCFKYSNTTAKTHMTAAYLITLGARHAEIDEALYETVSFDSLNIYPLFLKNCRRLYDGKVNLIPISNADKVEYSLTDADLDEVAALSRKTAGTQLGIVLRQRDGSENEFKASMRSRRSVNCSLICAHLGGGGHIRASGATIIAGSMEEAIAVMTDALDKTLVFE